MTKEQKGWIDSEARFVITEKRRVWYYGEVYHVTRYPWQLTSCRRPTVSGYVYDPETAKGYHKLHTDGLRCCRHCDRLERRRENLL